MKAGTMLNLAWITAAALLLASGVAHAQDAVARPITDPADLLEGPGSQGQLGDFLPRQRTIDRRCAR